MSTESFIDVTTEGFHQVSTPDKHLLGTWEIHNFIDPPEGMDYRAGDRAIWSIGRSADGRIYASLDARFYDNPRFECLWLR